MPLLRLERSPVTFQDLVLSDRTMHPLEEVIKEVRAQSVLHSHGLRPRTRMLFFGPPGCGKSMTAAAMANELGWQLARVDLATVVSSFLGETARNLATIFDYCRQGTWVLLFDEIDAVAKEREDRTEHGELKRVVATFLQELDAFLAPSVVIAATNHPLLLDSAVWRRFDEVVFFDLPRQPEIRRLIELKLRGMRHDLNVTVVARQMRGYAHSDVEMTCYGAIRRAILDNRDTVTQADMTHALQHMEDRKRNIQRSSA